MGSMSGDWEELQVEFCYSFSLTECIDSLPIDILDFEQLEKESIGAAWARFSCLLAPSPDLSMPDDVSFDIFCSGIHIKSALDLDVAAGGSFAHKTRMEGREILARLLEKSSFPTDHNEPHRQESDLIHERPSTAKSEFSPFASQDSSIEPSPEPRTLKEEEIQPSKFSFQFEDDPSRNFRNTSNHHRHEKPTTSLCLYETLNEDFHHTTIVDWL
jgi:hypothetical protein